jgi:hypothetical protein
MIYCTYNLLIIFRAFICPSSVARDILVLLPHMVSICSSSFPHPGRIACCPAPNRRQPVTKVLHTICGNNTSIVSSSWCWAYKCPKHVEQIIRAINHSTYNQLNSRIKMATFFDRRGHLQAFSCYKNKRTCSQWRWPMSSKHVVIVMRLYKW